MTVAYRPEETERIEALKARNRGDGSAWIQTFTGRAFPLLAPCAADVSISDIAHALSNLCRFAGHTRSFYSVAQHSVLVSRIVPHQYALQGLLHDAPEAYIVDIPRPLKRSGMIDGYRLVEERIWAAIAERFGVDLEIAEKVKEADNIALFTEQRDFMGRQTKPWRDPRLPLTETLVAWAPSVAKQAFMNRFTQLFAGLAALLLLVVFAVPTLAQQAGVYTKCYDNARTCAVTNETVLTPTAVLKHRMTLQTTIPVIGDRNGMEGAPLISSPLSMPCSSIQWKVPPGPGCADRTVLQRVLVLPSMANIIRGVRKEDGAGIWQTPQLCVPVLSDRGNPSANDIWHINDHFGFVSTGLIDPDTLKLYEVATCSKDGSGSQASMEQRMFVLDVRTGAVLANTLVTGSDHGVNYGDAPRKPRAALIEWKRNGVKFVIMEAGSFAETGANATGWMLAFDTFDNRFKAARSFHAGLWQTGLGPLIDDDTGLIYTVAGNGPFDHVTGFGEAAMQIQFTPRSWNAAAAQTTPASFTVLHAWALYSDAARTCANPQLTQPRVAVAAVAGESAPSSLVPGADMPMSTDCSPQWGDQDFGLTHTLLRKQHIYLVCGKDGICAAIDTRHFPDSYPKDFANSKANCAKVRLYEMGWDLAPDIPDPCPANMAKLNDFPGTRTRHQHSPIAQLEQDGVTYVLVFAENSPLQAWRANADGTFTFIARGAEMASAGATGMHGGMPGGFGVVSSHDDGQDAIAWYSVPDGDANRSITTGRLIAYDLRNLAAMAGTGKMIPTLWTSPPYVFNKFMTPTVSDGQVYLPNYNGGVPEWGLGR